MGREGLWFVSGSTPRRDNKRRTWIDLSKNPRVSLPCLVPLSKAPYSPNICSPSALTIKHTWMDNTCCSKVQRGLSLSAPEQGTLLPQHLLPGLQSSDRTHCGSLNPNVRASPSVSRTIFSSQPDEPRSEEKPALLETKDKEPETSPLFIFRPSEETSSVSEPRLELL
ncbi:unnamed protein product [Pleuronectes platessa]|uniref:Uncharacterized protein n=1 Tax=Pleuronectes platessa TaxID=8262 RepID=A0A9N7TVG6_PLEPL|nr:unnamed protein product [Pleuronectes platessa]